MNDVYTLPKLKAMFYGNPGCGKTTLIGTASSDERLAPVLILNAKGNPHVLRKNKVRPDVVEIREMADFNEPYEWLTKHGQDPKHPFAVDFGLNPPYQTVVVDALTEVQRHVVRKVSGGESIHPGDLMPLLGRQGFGQLLGTMLNWANYYLELDMNVILTSHEAEKEGKVWPLLWGQSGNELAGYALLVGRIVTRLAAPANLKAEFEEGEYNIMQVLETEKVYAKDQYDMGVDLIGAPTLTKVMDLIEQGS